MKGKPTKLVFENGVEMLGTAFGAQAERLCEVVLNSSMCGYQEIVTDSANYNQLVCMAYPLIGNSGMADEDYESRSLHLGGLIVREYNDSLANFRASKTLREVMEEQGVPGIEGVDTRRIARMLAHKQGPLRALLCDAAKPTAEALAAFEAPAPQENALQAVSCTKKWYYRSPNVLYNVAAVDCGLNHSMLASLGRRRCNITVLPSSATAEEVLALSPAGVLVAGGPGNPLHAHTIIELVKRLEGRLPLFGIGIGMQAMALAAGCTTYTLPFGHRGGNYPVLNIATGKIEITSQNHGYAVDTDSVAGSGLTITHTNVLDGTVEGISNPKRMMFGVQYHPEPSPGCEDSAYVYDQFIQLMQKFGKGVR